MRSPGQPLGTSTQTPTPLSTSAILGSSLLVTEPAAPPDCLPRDHGRTVEPVEQFRLEVCFDTASLECAHGAAGDRRFNPQVFLAVHHLHRAQAVALDLPVTVLVGL